MSFTERYVTTTASGSGDGSAGNPWTLSQAAASAVAGDRVNIKAGTYALSAAFTPANSGTAAAPIAWRGYTTTPGDAAAPVAVFDRGGAADTVVAVNTDYQQFECIAATANDTASGSAYAFNASGVFTRFFRCRAFAARRGFRLGGTGSMALGCEASDYTDFTGYQLAGANTLAIGCVARNGNAGFGFSGASTGGCSYCIAANMSTAGFRIGVGPSEYSRALLHCVAYGCGTAGFELSATSAGPPIVLANCLMVNNAAHGIAADAGGHGTAILLGCGFYGNSSGEVDSDAVLIELVPRISLPGDPFVDAAAGDFRIRAESPALAGGWPAAFLVGGAPASWAAAPDLGAAARVPRAVVNAAFVGALA